MHRSGASLFASMLAAAGVRLGDQLLPTDNAIPRGCFEDAEFLSLNRALLDKATPKSSEGHRDWGWTVDEVLDRTRFDECKAPAESLVASRRQTPGPWGWKDPRTSLTLEFWHRLLMESNCDPLYVLVYRFPWDVADSMQRLGVDVFLNNPEYSYRIWSFYNRELLSFAQQHRERCVLLSSNALWHEPELLRAKLSEKLGLEVPSSAGEIGDKSLWRAVSGSDPLIGLVEATSRGCIEILADLDRCADLSSSQLWNRPGKLRARFGSPVGNGPVDLSIVVPCHDHGEFLIDAIASVERFAPDRTELIIVNDGSAQARTVEILRILRDAGYQIIDQPQSGLPASRNRGIEAAHGRFILPLDADNRICGGFAETAIQILDNDPGVGVVYGDRYDFGKRNGRVEVPELDIDRLLLGNYIDACAVFRKALWTDCGGYDTDLLTLEDWELWFAAIERGWGFRRIDAITFEYRVRPQSLISVTLVPEIVLHLKAHVTAKHRALFAERIVAHLTQKDQVLIEMREDRAIWRGRAEAAEHGIVERDERLAIVEMDRASWVQSATAAQRELAERDERLARSEKDLARLKESMTLAERELAERDARLGGVEKDLAQVVKDLAQVNASLRESQRESLAWKEGCLDARASLEVREAQLSAIQSSATWRWTQRALRAWPVRRLLGGLIRAVSRRSKRTVVAASKTQIASSNEKLQ